MEKKQLLKKLKEIEILSKVLSVSIFNGNYSSHFKGNGMEFVGIRKYEQGDDVRKIDWKTTARHRKTYVKEYEEEKEQKVFLVIDSSTSNMFLRQREIVTLLSGCIGFSANKNNDKVGAVFFSDKIEKIIPLKKGKNHTFSILDTLLSLESKNKKTDISQVLDYFIKKGIKNNLIFLISDFYDNSNYQDKIKILQINNDVISIRVRDKKYDELPKGFIYTLEDSETGEEIILENNKPKDINTRNIKDMVTIDTNEDFVLTLAKFFNRRRKI